MQRDPEQGRASPAGNGAGAGLWAPGRMLGCDYGIMGIMGIMSFGMCSAGLGMEPGAWGRGAAAADGRRVAAYKYLPGSKEEVGGLSSSLNEINGSEA